MELAQLDFYFIAQDSQDLGSDDEHMVSRLFFRFTYKGTTTELVADIKQAVGSTFDSSELEVSRPHDYGGPFNYEYFRDFAEQVYREEVGRRISVNGRATVRMRNNSIKVNVGAEMPVDPSGAGW